MTPNPEVDHWETVKVWEERGWEPLRPNCSDHLAALKFFSSEVRRLREEAKASEKVVYAAQELNSAMSEGAWKDEPRMGYDEVQINKHELAQFKAALAAYDSRAKQERP